MFGQAYHEALQELTTPDMARIKLLRDLARENKAEAANVVQVMAKHTQTVSRCALRHTAQSRGRRTA